MKFDKDFVVGAVAKNKRILAFALPALAGIFCLVALLGQCANVTAFEKFGFIILCYLICFYVFIGHKFARLNNIFFWIVPTINFFVLEGFMNDPLAHIQILTIGFNLLFYYLFFLFLLFVSKNRGLAVIVSSTLSYSIGLVNYAVIAFRQNPVLPWDLMSVGTAVKVAGNYRLPITIDLVLLSAWFLLLFVFGLFIYGQKRVHRKTTSIISILGVVAFFILTCFFAQSPSLGNYIRLRDSFFVPSTYFASNGYVLGFVRSLQYVNVNEPFGYSIDEAELLLERYDLNEENNTDKLPNIIVIMNEAFSDLSVLGDFTVNQECLPYWNSLSDNTVRGNLHVSVKGGNTANSEFEFLTSNSMAFLTTGSVPYELYIKNETPSLASYLKDNFNYDTYGVHSYEANAWRRNEVYPLLGFDHTVFMEDFPEDAEKIRKFISDAATYDAIIELYENRDINKNFFTFCVTVQNHGGYNVLYDNFTPDVVADGLEDAFTLNHYLSLIKESDKAFRDLLGYFETVDEPTVVLMFGDHQPTDEMISGLLEKVDLDFSILEDFEKQYITPFAIWANFDIKEAYIEAISCNYLSSVLLDVAGVPLSSYQRYLSEMQEKYPVITSNCVIDRSGNYISPEVFMTDAAILEYSKLQYYKLFGR